jgi:hypothetical protein
MALKICCSDVTWPGAGAVDVVVDAVVVTGVVRGGVLEVVVVDEVVVTEVGAAAVVDDALGTVVVGAREVVGTAEG